MITFGPKPPSVHLRQATLEDAGPATEVFLRSVREVGHAYYSPELTADWLTEFSVDDTRRMISSPDHHVVVASYGNELVGIAVLCFSKRTIEHCYVTGSGVRRGIGSAMLAELERMAVLKGLPEVTLQSSDGTQGFYEANGYRASGGTEMYREKFVVYPYAKTLAEN